MLSDRLRDRGCAVRSLAAEYVHFVDFDGEPTHDEVEALGRLLDDGEPVAQEPLPGTCLWVVPRLGTRRHLRTNSAPALDPSGREA